MVKVENDTCASIAERFEIIDGVKGLEALNPNLQCSDVIEPIAKGRLICVRKIKTGGNLAFSGIMSCVSYVLCWFFRSLKNAILRKIPRGYWRRKL